MIGKPFLKFSPYFLILIILILLVVISNFIWLRQDVAHPEGNALQDLLPAVNFYLDIKALYINLPNLSNIFETLPLIRTAIADIMRSSFFIYPPLVPISYSLFYILFGANSGLELIVNSIYLGLALYAIYGITKKILDERAGLVAAFIFSSFPGVISISREAYSEFIMMCLMTLTLYLLLKTDFFRHRIYSFFFGVSLALAALTKWEFPPTLIGPFSLVLWQSNILIKESVDKQALRRTILKNLLLAIITGTLIASIWYIPNIKDIIWRLFFREDENIFINNPTTWNPHLFSISTLTYYPLSIINTFISFFYFVLAIIIGVVFIYKAIKKRELISINSKPFYMVFLILWILIPYLFFTFIKINSPSHIIVVLPALAIIISIGIFGLMKRKIRIILISFVILYGLSSHLRSFLLIKEIEPLHNFKIYLRDDEKFVFTTGPGDYMRDSWETRCFYPPDTRDWQRKRILSFIKNDSLNSKNKPHILVLSNHRIMCSFHFQYDNLLGNCQVYVSPRGNDSSDYPSDPFKFDYIIFIDNNEKEWSKITFKKLVEHTPNLKQNVSEVDNFVNIFFQKYKVIKEYSLPENLTAKIYKLID